MKNIGTIISVLFSLLLLGSCIYQNEPLGPNRAPEIKTFSPHAKDLQIIAPDTCLFVVDAEDPDGDELGYRFFVNDSFACSGDSAEIYFAHPGIYDVKAKIYDAQLSSVIGWKVTALKIENEPPVITWYFPEQLNVAVSVGDTVMFHIAAEDDEPESLDYIFMRDSTMVSSGSPEFITRFLQRGQYLFSGIVWDGQYGDTVQWHLDVTGFPDTIPPAAIGDLTGWPGDTPGVVHIEWTAPGDDSTSGKASAYILRTSSFPIRTEEDWEGAAGKQGEPVPSPAGSREAMDINGLNPGTSLYVMIRCVDDFFNISPLGNCIYVIVRGYDIGGEAVNVLTGEGVAGITVSSASRVDTTDSEGHFFLKNVPGYATKITAVDEQVTGDKGSYYDFSQSIAIENNYTNIDLYMIPVLPIYSTYEPDPYQGNFYFFLKEITNTTGEYEKPTVWKNWNHWPVNVYNPPMVYESPDTVVDLQEEARKAMAEWEDITGLDLFTETTDSLSADAIIKYDDVNEYKHHVETIETNEDGTPGKRVMWIYLQNTSASVYVYPHVVYTHEFGHIIGLGHSRNLGHIMLGLTMPYVKHVSVDEANAVKIIYNLPPIIDFNSFLDD